MRLHLYVCMCISYRIKFDRDFYRGTRRLPCNKETKYYGLCNFSNLIHAAIDIRKKLRVSVVSNDMCKTLLPCNVTGFDGCRRCMNNNK